MARGSRYSAGGPKNCSGLFNWGGGHVTPRDLDEGYHDPDEYADEIRRLQGDVMPANAFPSGMSIRSASGAGCFGREPSR